jgi:hypothetical protein
MAARSHEGLLATDVAYVSVWMDGTWFELVVVGLHGGVLVI